MSIKRARGVKKATVAESIRADGTLVTEVTCIFVVHHASRCEMDKDTLAGLINAAINGEYVDPAHVESFKIIEANND
jgi:2-C-methyl-D-erythritol 4-phosphate cytidylyltransferase